MLSRKLLGYLFMTFFGLSSLQAGDTTLLQRRARIQLFFKEVQRIV